jgi:hypothetical protein
MPTIETSVCVDVDLDDFDDKDISEEYFSRGLDLVQPNDLHVYASAVNALQRKDYTEGFILLERCLPELKGMLVSFLSTWNPPTAASNISGAATGVRHRAASTVSPERETIPALDHHNL